jgi:hypothetical protein
MVRESGCCKANEPNHWAFFINHPDSNYLPTSESDSLLKKIVDDPLRHWKGMGKDEHDVKKKKKKKILRLSPVPSPSNQACVE